jgi:hypothetical protein
MTLTWPYQMDNCSLSAAQMFINVAQSEGFTNGKLAIDPLQSIPGEVDGLVQLNPQTGQPLSAIPGFPSGNYPACFVCRFDQCKDPNQQINIGQTLWYMQARNWTVAQALQACANVTLG